MIITIDVGNTNLSLGAFDKDVLINKWRLETTDSITCSDVMKSFSDNYIYDIEGISIGSVVPDIIQKLQKIKDIYNDVPVIIAGDEGVNIGVEVPFPNASDVGVDVLLNGLAGFEKYRKSLIIIDFGTATTFDLFDDNGTFRGNSIYAGVNLSLEALYKAAKALPRIEIKPTENIICTKTKVCIQSGIFWGYISMVEGMVQRIKAELPIHGISGESVVIATGGLATLFTGKTPIIEHVEDSLSLEGLYLLFKRNT